VLTPEAAKLQGPPASESQSLEAQVLGRMATCHLHLGRAESALPLLQQALGPHWYKKDPQALVIYLGCLFEAHRYLGHKKEAAQAAKEFAWALDRAGQERKAQAERLYKLAELFPNGEPLNRVMVDFQGVTRDLSELWLWDYPKVSLRFSFRRNRMDLAPSQARVQRGRELAREGRFEEALALFREAGPLDPHSPTPATRRPPRCFTSSAPARPWPCTTKRRPSRPAGTTAGPGAGWPPRSPRTGFPTRPSSACMRSSAPT